MRIKNYYGTLKKLANKGNHLALNFAGVGYSEGVYGFEKNVGLAEKYYQLTKNYKGLYYLYKELGKSDDVLLYYLKQVNPKMLSNYSKYAFYGERAELYFKTKDYVTAKKEYEYLLRKDDPREYGADAEEDAKLGIKAAERLGDIYYQGLGLRQDLAKAKEYYGIACDYKAQSACDKYREVNEKMR